MKQQKNKSGFGSFIAAFCIVIYLFALVQAAVRLYLSIEQCRITAGNEYNMIKNLAISSGQTGYMDERFIQTINNALLASEILEALIITGPEEDYAFEKQKNRAIEWVNNSPRFINRLSFSKDPYFDSLPINNVRNANIKAVANAFNFNDISKILKETLFIILIGFSISFITMIIQMLSGNTPKQKENYGNQGLVQTPYTEQFDDFENDSVLPADSLQTGDTEQKNVEPKGLYSARSNIGWEEYTQDRLDAEIHRCASSDKDLTFVIIEFDDILNDDVFKSIAEDASNILSSRDMLFENGNQGIFAILPGIGLDLGIAKSEKLYNRIKTKYPDYELNIGLTSRSGRLINADRLLLESREAIKRAKNDTATSIIAFKSDPDKYRAFISQN